MIHCVKKLCAAFLIGFSAPNAGVNNAYGDMQQRDLIILLDQDTETIGTNNTVFTTVLAGAIKEKIAPLLISNSLWHNFIERQQEFNVKAKIKDSKEQLLFSYYVAMQEKIATYFEFFTAYSQNPVEIKNLIAGKMISAFEHEEIHALQEKVIAVEDVGLYNSFALYLTEFNPTEWIFYQINDFFSLLIPHAYLYSLLGKAIKDVSQQEIEKVLGLKISDCRYIEDPTEFMLNSFIHRYRKSGCFIETLNKCLIKKESNNITWNIVMGGHGSNGNPKHNGAAINDLSLGEFHDFLQFLNEHTIIRTFYYTTCYGAGEHIQKPYMMNNQAEKFHFPIVLCALTDTTSYIKNCDVRMPTNNEQFCQNYTFTPQGGALCIAYPMNFTDFFCAIHNHTTVLSLKSLCDKKIIMCLVPDCVECLPQCRLPYCTEFVSWTDNDILHITPYTAALYHTLQQPFIISDSSVRAILLSASSIKVPIILHENSHPLFISLRSGNVTHYIHKIEAPTLFSEQLIRCFWPLEHSVYDKLFLIDELMCANNPDAFEAHYIHATENILTLYNIIIILQQDSLMRIFFTTQQGICFSLYSKQESFSSFHTIRELSDKEAQEYKQLFEKKRYIMLNQKNEQENKFIAGLGEIYRKK